MMDSTDYFHFWEAQHCEKCPLFTLESIIHRWPRLHALLRRFSSIPSQVDCIIYRRKRGLKRFLPLSELVNLIWIAFNWIAFKL